MYTIGTLKKAKCTSSLHHGRFWSRLPYFPIFNPGTIFSSAWYSVCWYHFRPTYRFLTDIRLPGTYTSTELSQAKTYILRLKGARQRQTDGCEAPSVRPSVRLSFVLNTVLHPKLTNAFFPASSSRPPGRVLELPKSQAGRSTSWSGYGGPNVVIVATETECV